MVLGERYKNTHNFIKNKSNMSGTILYGLSMTSSTNLNIHLLRIFFSFNYFNRFYVNNTVAGRGNDFFLGGRAKMLICLVIVKFRGAQAYPSH